MKNGDDFVSVSTYSQKKGNANQNSGKTYLMVPSQNSY
jgi:hypothetical protein